MIYRRTTSSYITQRNFVLAVAGAVLAAIIGFFAYEFKFLRSPNLEVLDPPRDLAIAQTAYEVRGRGEADADLTLNGRPLYSGETGEFAEGIHLFQGVNRLEFEAKNRYGKTTRVTRYIVVQ